MFSLFQVGTNISKEKECVVVCYLGTSFWDDNEVRINNAYISLKEL
jgi:hypothetical protein